ncbi:MAG: MFS transporter [Rubrivivax sp.]|nr:MFS transporter [Rubrivivax sp.]
MHTDPPPSATPKPPRPFFGPQVVRAAFVLAAFGWGVGFYGPPVFLHAVGVRTGWPLALVSLAVTLHFLFGALVVARLHRLHARFGLPATTACGAAAAALGLLGWATASEPWQLFGAALLSGGGWVTMGAAAINAVIAPWFARRRPLALAQAYNGASIGGALFTPLWVALIAALGFTGAAALVGLVMTGVVATLAFTVFARTPAGLGQAADGDAPGTVMPKAAAVRPLPGRGLWRERRFVTLAAGMALGLFAQIGLIAHLFSLLVPALGAQAAGVLMGLATAAAIGGRFVAARFVLAGAERCVDIAAGFAVQVLGTALLLAAGGTDAGLLVLGALLFGSGIGNATSLPPLVAQAEFAAPDVQRVVSLIVAIGQASYAFAPLAFGLLLAAGAGDDGAGRYFVAIAAVQLAAAACYLAGRVRRPATELECP